jgi:uncharacterized protein (DUF1330 family)
MARDATEPHGTPGRAVVDDAGSPRVPSITRGGILPSIGSAHSTRAKGGDMTAYLVADITITDPQEYQEYTRQVEATIQRFGGRYIVRGATSQPQVVEGDWLPTRITILEFPDMEQAKAWYDSPEYVAIRGIRQRASDSHLVFVQGA